MQGVVSAQRLIDWLQLEGDIAGREEGVALGQELFATGILRHGRKHPHYATISFNFSPFISISQLLTSITFKIAPTSIVSLLMTAMKSPETERGSLHRYRE